MRNRNLELELRLMILRYGKRSIIQALASIGEQTADEIERELCSIEQAQKKSEPKKPAKSILDIAAEECQKHPDLADPIRALALGYKNRTFLPHLREVQRFLDKNGAKHGKLRSRDTVAELLVRTLVSLPKDELVRLAKGVNSPSDSDYSLLARAIMGDASGSQPAIDKNSIDAKK